jgi:hypothetical protein
MGSLRSLGVLALTLAAPAAPALAQSAPAPAAPAGAEAEPARPHKSVYGTLESVDASHRGVIMKTNAGDRMAWRFDAAVIAELARFKAGDPMIVIYRQISSNEKRVTAIAFPGTATSALYVNMTGSRVRLRSAPAVGGVCGQADAGPVDDSVIPAGGMGEAPGACWCCAGADQSCTPGNKTGQGKALLVSCFE